MQKTTNSTKETFDFARSYAKKLHGGDIIGLIGELGAGKTVFVKGLAVGLGVKQVVTSPTFVLMKIYEIKNQKSKIKNLCHIDAYRIKTGQDIIAIGAEEYFNRTDTITVIEWVDKINPAPLRQKRPAQKNLLPQRCGVKKILPKKARYVKIDSRDKNKRLINFWEKKYERI